MKSSRKRKVTAAFFAAAALGGVAHAAPTLNMNDLVGSNTTTESTTQGTTNVATPVVRPMATQPIPATAQPIVVAPQQAVVRPVQVQPMAPVRIATPQMVPTQSQPVMQTQQVMQPSATPQTPPKVTPLIPRVRPVPVNDIAKALSDQQRAVSQPQYVVNKQTNAVMEPTLAMHSLMNVQRKTEPVTVQKQVDGKQQVQTTQVVRTPVMVQQESTTPLVIANTTQTKAVVAKQRLTIRDIQRAERERLAQLAAEEAAQQSGANQVDQQMVAQKQAEAQRQAAILAEQQRQMAMQAEQQRLAQQQAEAQRQAAMQAEQQRLAAQQAEAQRQAALRAEQERIAAEQAEQARIAEAQRQAAEQERLRIQEEQHRIAAQQQAEQQRLAAEQAEAQRQAAMQAEQQRLAAQQAEAQRQAALQAEQQRLATQQAEAQRQAALQAEQDRIAAQQAEAQRQAALKAEQDRIGAEQAEAQRQAALKAEQDRIAAEQAEAQRQAALKAEQERIAAEQAKAQRQAALQAEQERIAAEQAEAQRQAALKAEQERIAAEQAEAQRQAALKAEQERLAAQQAEAQRQAALKAEQERLAAQQAEAQRQAALKAEQERIAAQQAEAQRQAALKAEQERIAAEQAARQRAEAAAKAEAERQAAIKAEQDRIAAQQAELARQAAIKEEQERLAAEQLAKEEAEAAAKAQAQAEAEAKAKAEAEAKAKAEAEAKAKAQAAAKAQAEAEAKAKAEAEAAAKAQAEAEAKAKAEAEAKAKAEAEAAAKAQESKLPQSYVDARNEASTKSSAVTEEKNILSQPMEPPLQADSSAKISLAFDAKNYESMSTTVDNKEIKYRAFEYIPYVANPIDIDQQYMNIYVPEEYFNNGTVNGYNTQTAPIFMPNAVGGYMPSQAMTPKVENGKPNSVLYALSRGYVVASPATRGRTNKASDGNFIGKAPAVIVDLQAATAYLHANDSTMPGNANRIITNGTSAGGAVSLLQGAAGNNSDFQPYLQALGAATAATNVYAVSAYAPITNLDAADMAYEWSYKGITSFNKVTMGQGELPQANVGGNTAPPQRTMQRVNLNANDVAYSNLLSEHFPEYVNNLQLRDAMGRVLKLDKNGNGTFKNYVKAFIIDAANKAQAKGTDLSKHTYLVRDGKTGAIKDINWEAYNQFVSRSKAPGAFDSRSNDSGENNLFGTSTTDNNHFTITAALHDTTPNQDVYVENAKIVTMMNPMNYLGSPAATNARYYRIRYGTADSNTSVAIPLIVGARAQNLGYNVDMATPFGVDHSGDYDLDELFNWMDNIVKNGR
ncbi:subtype B tannase [uncultured Veillonella sp.]|uniref:subtype B tannase n=1 Tax=uncultured Veillonella sp. TaxID=159268 RepID=UPI0025E6AEC7|nr:subtype B tannase [uncultured Veillonella sp.]